jgi:cell division protein FtsA
MARKAAPEIHVSGIDIGTSHVRVVIGNPRDGRDIDVVGIGQAPARGLRKGVVVNLDATVESIRAAVAEAELMAGLKVRHAHVGVSGAHVKGLNSRGVVAVASGGAIGSADVERVLEAARAIQIPRDREVLHVVPQDFTVDDQEDVADPIGMQGSRLEANVHVVTAGATSTQNLITCVNRAGIQVRAMVLECLAAAECTLTEDERELGVALVDMGASACDVGIFEKGAIWHAATIQAGGDHFTNDIAVGLRAPIPDAERLKRKHGHALSSMVAEDAVVEVPSVGGGRPRQLAQQILAEIIQPRAEEIFGLVKEEIDRAGHARSLNAGVVLCGGASLMPGMVEVAEQVFELPVRRATPRGIGGLVDVVATPSFATGVGLVQWGHRHGGDVEEQVEEAGFSVGRLGGRMVEWLADVFEPVAHAVRPERAAR